MSSPASLPPSAPREAPSADGEALSRVALAVAHPGGPELFADLVHELAAGLQVPAVFVAVFPEHSRTTMRTLAVSLDGRSLPNFEFPVAGVLAAAIARRSFQFIP